MGTLFGTDGIRGPADGPFFTASQLARIAAGIARHLGVATAQKPFHAVIGRDPRASGERILGSLARALAREGIRVFDAGIVPTPAVAKAVIDMECDLGVMITASHNPASDNGIKLFTRGGRKFSAAEEAAIEAAILAVPSGGTPLPWSVEEGDVFPCEARAHYIQYVQSLLHVGDLDGWKIVVDTAHGATTGTTPAVLRALGAEVITLGDAPDGRNINAGVGSEHPEELAARVVAEGARLGLAHDGDGDRLVVVDEHGEVVPGDAIIGLLARAKLKEGILARKTVVVTVMSNFGLDATLAEDGGRVVRTGVGDRQVAEAMAAEGYSFGGEASGHLIFSEWLPTGDGLIAALRLLRALRMSDQPLSTLAAGIRLYPQGQRNIPVAAKPELATLSGWSERLRAIEEHIPGGGRVLVRYSGTEPKLRLLAEAPSGDAILTTLDALESLAQEFLGVG